MALERVHFQEPCRFFPYRARSELVVDQGRPFLVCVLKFLSTTHSSFWGENMWRLANRVVHPLVHVIPTGVAQIHRATRVQNEDSRLLCREKNAKISKLQSSLPKKCNASFLVVGKLAISQNLLRIPWIFMGAPLLLAEIRRTVHLKMSH